MSQGSMFMNLRDIKEITKDFSEDLKIGNWSCGTVYRGVYSGEEIVVKLLDEERFGYMIQEKKISRILRMSHPNIERFVGFCFQAEHKYGEWRDYKILCSEYLEGGSLDKYLIESHGHDWRIRYNIIKGVCEGLDFIHRRMKAPICHLNPTNILLDKSFLAKITNFGMSMLLDGPNTWTENILGKIPYTPPECFIRGQVGDKKYDVYSLGIIIIQIVTGYTGYSRFCEMDVTQFIELVNINWRKCINATTSPCPSAEWDQVDACIRLAIKCVDQERDNRLTAAEIVHILKENEKLLPVEYWAPFVMGKEEASCTNLMKQFGDMHGDHEMDMQTTSTLDHMSLQYLKDITNNFCNERILGRGGFGAVYKGVLGNGKMVAVKKLVQSMSSSLEQFENEINLLMKLKLPNIVQLVGYCYETQHLRNYHEGKFIFAWNTECLLCLEFLPKGSLEKYISDASSGLDWPTRLQIIEGISYGLQYLHEQPEGPIIHLDLKPANILIDVNMIPKITDFGLSRMFDKKTIHTAITSGTLGYMPPEYVRGIITPMSDVFSLGVIIMEVITGHRNYPYDIRESSMEFIELELQKWRTVMQKEPVYTSLGIYCQQITRCIQIGLICVNPERTKRPTVKKIIDMLQGLESMDWYISNELSIQPQHPGGATVI